MLTPSLMMITFTIPALTAAITNVGEAAVRGRVLWPSAAGQMGTMLAESRGLPGMTQFH